MVRMLCRLEFEVEMGCCQSRSKCAEGGGGGAPDGEKKVAMNSASGARAGRLPTNLGNSEGAPHQDRGDCGRLYPKGGRRVPTISEFYGIVIQMFWRDHGPPHFHALYAEHEALIDPRNLKIMRGSLPGRAQALVLEWADAHREELMENWNLCGEMKPPNPIEPLP